MTRAEWTSVIKNTLAKIDEQARFRPAFLDRHIQSVYEMLFSEAYKQNKRGIWKYVRDYSETISGSTANLATGRTMATLPIVLPREGGGVFAVSSTGKTYILTSYQAVKNLISTTYDTAGVKGSYLAAVRGDKLYGNTTVAVGETLTYSLIPKFTSLAVTDEVLIPDGMEEHFIDRIIDTLQHVPMSDLINDNTITQ